MIKDFATEPNEERFRKASQYMAQRLAGSLALVTCKEPLKSNMATHLRQHLFEAGFGEVSHHLHKSGSMPNSIFTQLQEPVTQILVQENLDVACAAIEKAAMERAGLDIEDNLAQSIDSRRRHREVLLTLFGCSRLF